MVAEAQKVAVDELSFEQKQLLSSFYGFAKYYLGMQLCDEGNGEKVGECRDREAGITYYDIARKPWQRELLQAVDRHGSKVTAATCNGAGKTSKIIPGAVLPFMALNPRGKVVITSGVDRQVREQIFPHTNALVAKSLKGWHATDAKITAPNGAHCVGFTAREGGHFEGWHGNPDELYELFQHDGPLMIVVDEAKSVSRAIFDAIERCTYQHLLLVSSCGGPSGEFYESHNAARSSYSDHFKIPAGLCPHADHAKNLALIQRRGLKDPLVLSKVFAEFMVSSEGAIINGADLITNLQNPPMERRMGNVVIFCDYAAGGDENTIAHKSGNKIRLVKAWRETDTMKAVGQFIREFRRLGVDQANASCIYGDNDGLGRVINDRLHELGWLVNRWSNGAKANRPEEYLNRGTEMWYEGAKAIERQEYLLEIDEETQRQLTQRSGRVHSSGRLAVETKEEMKKRLGYSPDRAEVILGCMTCQGHAVVQNLVRQATPFEQFAEMQHQSGNLVEMPAGMEAGS